MTTLAMINGKGGVGRTTLAVHLALYASELGIKTIGVSLERTGGLSYWLNDGKEPPEEQVVWKNPHLGFVYSPHDIPEYPDASLVIYDCPPRFEIRDAEDDVRPRLAFKPLHPVWSAPPPKPGKYMHWRPGARPPDFWIIPTPANPYGLELLEESLVELAGLGGAVRCVLYQPWKEAALVMPALHAQVSRHSNVEVLDHVVLEDPRFAEVEDQRRPIWEGPEGDDQCAQDMRRLCGEILAQCGLTPRH
jgi:hypothetical protein